MLGTFPLASVPLAGVPGAVAVPAAAPGVPRVVLARGRADGAWFIRGRDDTGVLVSGRADGAPWPRGRDDTAAARVGRADAGVTVQGGA